MAKESTISVDANELRTCSTEDALGFADFVLGASSLWEPSLVAYRLTSEFQEDWKVEVGCWLLEAQQHGFLPALRKRLERAQNESRELSVVGANDSAHRVLLSELAPAMLAYYLCRRGWTFVSWEPTVPLGDVDVRLRCPFGNETDFQVKAPDRPGDVRDNRIVDGESDRNVLAAIDKAIRQISVAPGPQRCVVFSPQRTRPIPPKTLAIHLLGRTVALDGELVLRSVERGAFATPHGSRVGAVADLGLLRGAHATVYRCTVFLNPWAPANTAPLPQAFPAARVCHLVGDRFVWTPEQPDRTFSLPTGTRYID